MRLVTWNVNSMTARLDFVLEFLGTIQPDAACIQELKVDDDAFPHQAFEAAGYNALTHGQAQWNGVAVLVKKSADPSPTILQRGLPGQEAAGARFLTVSALGLSLSSVYVPNGKSLTHPDFKLKLRFLDALADHLASHVDPSSEAVIGGDFNLVPGDLDTFAPAAHAGHIFHTPDERSRFERLAQAGLTDLFRARHPELQAFTWWDYRAGAFHKKQGLRIDFMLGTERVQKRVTEAGPLRDFRKKREGRIPSDHAPVVIDLA